MVLSRLFFATSLILFSLLILASASDYSYSSKNESYVSIPKPELHNSKSTDQGYSPKSSEDQQNYGSKPDSTTDEESKPQDYNIDSKPQPDKEKDHDYKPQPKEENGHDSTPDYKPQPNKENDHDSKPQPEQKDDLNSKPEYKPQPSKENGDDSKPDTYNKPQPEIPGNNSKPIDEEPEHGSKPAHNEPESHEKGKLLPTCIEGLVFCRKGPKYIPVKGAVVRITCQVVGDDDECETFYSDVTDANGYFFKRLSSLKLTDGLKLKECKAFLEDSPMEDCKIPTDVNRGIRGALLNSYRILDHNNIRLFKVGPFFYTSESQYPNNGLTK